MYLDLTVVTYAFHAGVAAPAALLLGLVIAINLLAGRSTDTALTEVKSAVGAREVESRPVVAAATRKAFKSIASDCALATVGLLLTLGTAFGMHQLAWTYWREGR